MYFNFQISFITGYVSLSVLTQMYLPQMVINPARRVHIKKKHPSIGCDVYVIMGFIQLHFRKFVCDQLTQYYNEHH